MIHKFLCRIGIHMYEAPYVSEAKRSVACDPRAVSVTDYRVRRRCPICGHIDKVMDIIDPIK